VGRQHWQCNGFTKPESQTNLSSDCKDGELLLPIEPHEFETSEMHFDDQTGIQKLVDQ